MLRWSVLPSSLIVIPSLEAGLTRFVCMPQLRAAPAVCTTAGVAHAQPLPGLNRLLLLSHRNGGDGDYNTVSGTSMATPLVAGAAALIWSAKPTATYAQVK